MMQMLQRRIDPNFGVCRPICFSIDSLPADLLSIRNETGLHRADPSVEKNAIFLRGAAGFA